MTPGFDSWQGRSGRIYHSIWTSLHLLNYHSYRIRQLVLQAQVFSLIDKFLVCRLLFFSCESFDYIKSYPCVCVSHSVVSDSLWPHRLLPTRLLSMEFSRQEYWSGLPFPSPEDLPDPGIELWSPALQADSLLFELQGSQGRKSHPESII